MSRKPVDPPPPASSQLGPLKGGRQSFAPEILAHNQRERLIAAIAQIVGEKGYAGTTIGEIADVASVSRRTLYEHFSGKEECFMAAYSAVDVYITKIMNEAVEKESQWPDQAAAALAALINFLAAHPHLARLYLVESAAVGDASISDREKTSERLIDLLAPGREFGPEPHPTEGMEEVLAGGILVLLGRQMVAGEASQLSSLIPAMIEFSLLPYLGVNQAREIAARHSSSPSAPE